MSGTLIQSEFIYQSGTPPQVYRFTIVSSGREILFRDLQDRYGFVISPYTQIPQSVQTDITAAMSQVEALLSLTSAVSGTVTFVSEASKTVTFATPFPDTSYRVHLTSDIFAPFRVTSKTLLGFTIEAGAQISATVGYDVLV